MALPAISAHVERIYRIYPIMRQMKSLTTRFVIIITMNIIIIVNYQLVLATP